MKEAEEDEKGTTMITTTNFKDNIDLLKQRYKGNKDYESIIEKFSCIFNEKNDRTQLKMRTKYERIQKLISILETKDKKRDEILTLIFHD